MRQSSRQILRYRRSLLQAQPMSPLGWIILAALFLGIVIWFVLHPLDVLPVATIGGAFWLWIRLAGVVQARKFNRMGRERSGETICQFARHFAGSDFDPVVVRAVYETTQELYGRTDLPIRPSDRFSKDFSVCGEDLHDLCEEVAQLAHRSLEAAEQNPLWGKVHTVAELVRFMQFQSRLPE
jgi:hypothetical protein